MDIGTYTAASGGLLQLRRLEIVNNNLANVNTPGFKGQVLIAKQREFEETLASKIVENDPYAKPDFDRTPSAVHVATVTDFTQGPVQHTGNPLDAALRQPKDFFVVNGEGGEELYTRAGDFTLNNEGQLVTPDGSVVQGEGGQIEIDGPGAAIAPGGSVLVRGREVGRLRVVRFEDTSGLERAGNNRFKLSSAKDKARPAAVEDPQIEPGALEMSNVSAVSSMIELISTNRAFSAYTKVAESLDTMNNTAISRLGGAR